MPFNALVITKPESGYRCDLTELDEAPRAK